ncbi:hypothetical protein DPMN_087283 [Dreissena polymorpha]|uniref:Uncharacterized protein n=1 Tax=Dreissena polymorpha TaxID=45954 RepID=A0A9D4KSY5_DREPO|nr:hypothetical protein DPMN_087283 [Dreissena polymorpha]
MSIEEVFRFVDAKESAKRSASKLLHPQGAEAGGYIIVTKLVPTIKIKKNQRNLISVTYSHIATRVAMKYEPLLLFAKRYAQAMDKRAQNANANTTLHQCADSPQRDNLLNMKVPSLIP